MQQSLFTLEQALPDYRGAPAPKTNMERWEAGDVAPGVRRLDPQTFENLLHGAQQHPDEPFYDKMKVFQRGDPRLDRIGKPAAWFSTNPNLAYDYSVTMRGEKYDDGSEFLPVEGRVYTADVRADRPIFIDESELQAEQRRALEALYARSRLGYVTEDEYNKKLWAIEDELNKETQARYSIAKELNPDLIVSSREAQLGDHYIALDPESIRLKEGRRRGFRERHTSPAVSYIPDFQPGGDRYAEFERAKAARERGGMGKTRARGI